MVDPALCAQRYFTPRPKTGLQARECGASKINPASDLLGALAVCDEHRDEVLINWPKGNIESKSCKSVDYGKDFFSS